MWKYSDIRSLRCDIGFAYVYHDSSHHQVSQLVADLAEHWKFSRWKSAKRPVGKKKSGTRRRDKSSLNEWWPWKTSKQTIWEFEWEVKSQIKMDSWPPSLHAVERGRDGLLRDLGAAAGAVGGVPGRGGAAGQA